MKETKMEKLLDLFIEYIEKENEFGEITGVGYSKEKGEITKFYIEYLDEYDDDEQRKYFAIEKVLSKKFGFIKWLQENDKLIWNNKMKGWEMLLGMPERQDYYLMMLSVSPDAIEFLNSILK